MDDEDQIGQRCFSMTSSVGLDRRCLHLSGACISTSTWPPLMHNRQLDTRTQRIQERHIDNDLESPTVPCILQFLISAFSCAVATFTSASCLQLETCVFGIADTMIHY